MTIVLGTRMTVAVFTQDGASVSNLDLYVCPLLVSL